MSLGLGANNNNNHIDHGNITAINGATALTLAFWLWGGNPNRYTQIDKGSLTLASHWTSGQIRVREVGIWDLYSPEVLDHDDGLWVYYMLVYDGTLDVTSRLTLYKNAVSVPFTGPDMVTPQGTNASTTAPVALPSSVDTLQVGVSNTTGKHGHLRLWSAALTLTECILEMHRYWASRQINLLLDAPYDDALDARDYSGNNNHGTWDPASGTPGQEQGPPISYGASFGLWPFIINNLSYVAPQAFDAKITHKRIQLPVLTQPWFSRVPTTNETIQPGSGRRRTGPSRRVRQDVPTIVRGGQRIPKY